MSSTFTPTVYRSGLWSAWLLLLATTSALAEDQPAVLAKAREATVLVDMGARGTGSGFCFDRRGYFLTNAHVVDSVDLGGKASLIVQPGTAQEKVHSAVVISIDPEVDLAVLHAPTAKDMEVLSPVGKSGVAEADQVYCLGYPFGKRLSVKNQKYPSLSVNTGTISAVRRAGENIEVLQIDASVNPGHSGGPVVTRSGAVAGVLYTAVRGANLCFAIPAETVGPFLKRPGATVHVPEIKFVDRRQPREFSIEFLSFQESPLPEEVSLSLQPELGSARTFKMTKSEDRFTISAAAEMPKNPVDGLCLELVKGAVRRRVLTDDRAVSVGGAERMLSSIRMLEKHDKQFIVTGVDGQRIAAVVSGLDEIEAPSLPTSTSPSLVDADRIVVCSTETNSAGIYYQFVAKSGKKTVGRWEGLLPVQGRPVQLRPDAIPSMTRPSAENDEKAGGIDRNEVIRESRIAQAEWEKMPRLAEEDWTPLSLTKAELTSGGKVEMEKDNVIDFFNADADRDTYTLQFQLPVPLSEVTGLRLEVLPSPRLHRNGPGQFYGNFVLTNLEATALDPKTGKSTVVPIRRISADHFQKDGPTEWKVQHALDGDPGSGWAIQPKSGERHMAVLEIALRQQVADDQRTLVLKLDQNYGSRHTIGRLRVCITSHKRPLVCAAVPWDVHTVLQIPRDKRSPEQLALVEGYFDGTDLRLQPAVGARRLVPLASALKEYDPYVPPVDEIELEVRVCGKSRLIVARDGLRWEHQSGIKPGLGGKSGPHALVDGIPWYLRWESTPPTTDAPDNSYPFELFLGAAVWDAKVLTIVNDSNGERNDGRGTVRTTHERFETVFDFDDAAEGNGIYRVRLSARR